MDEPRPGDDSVFKSRRREECMESRLVLEASGIAARAEFHGGWWMLIVNEDDVAAAAAELDAYRQENLSRTTGIMAAIPVYAGAVSGVLAYAAVIISVGIITLPGGPGWPLFQEGQMQAGQVMEGQVWRTVTALTLHLDEGHLASNLLFGALFGFLAGRVLGGGVAWLSIVVAGALGNLVNAMVQSREHNSVGASTAVFAALGVIVANALRPRSSSRESLLRRWAPLVGGVMMLSFIGVGGERTDVLAHVTGLMAGLVIGWGSSRLPDHWLSSGKVQWWAGFSAIAIVSLSWLVAIAMAI
jgi:rhomboid protease GluP